MQATQCMWMERNTPFIFCPVESSIQNVLQSLVSASVLQALFKLLAVLFKFLEYVHEYLFKTGT